MKKFIINDVIITKSEKDLKICDKRIFDEKINVIFGSNESGKSSLMNFIKTAFFKADDCGIINFSICEDNIIKKYRAEIKNFGRLDKRLNLCDESGNVCDNALISEFINKKYFEQGFTVTLDDLMNIQNKDTSTLKDVIKDPTGELLYEFEEKIKSEIKKLFGDNNRPTKELNNISNEISVITKEINLRQNDEKLYNDAIETIKKSDEKLKEIAQNEKYAELIIELKKIKSEYDSLTAETEIVKSKYNNEFYEQKRALTEIIKNAGIYELNLSQIDKLKNKITDFEKTISEMQNVLKTEYSFIPEPEFIKNFNAVNFQKNKIKSYLTEENELRKTLAISASQNDISAEALFKTELFLKSSKNELMPDEEYSKLKKLYSELKSGSEHYTALSLKENELQKTSLALNGRYMPGFIICSLSIISGFFVSCFGVFFHNSKVMYSGIFFTVIGFFVILTIFKYYRNNDVRKEQKLSIELKNTILSDLKSELTANNIELTSDETTYLSVKFNEILTELRLKSEKYEKLKEFIIAQEQECAILNEKIRKNNEIISKLEQKSNQINNEIKSIITENGFAETVTGEEYLEMTIIISELQNNLKELEILQKELNEKKDINKKISTELENFIAQTGTAPIQCNSFPEKINFLKNYDENNNKHKQIIDELKIKSDIIKNKMNEIEAELKEFYNINPEQLTLNELKDKKEKILAEKKEAEYTKKSLESVESLNDLKITGEIALKDYRQKTEELIKNKMILSLSEKAKKNFNKIQPCLNEAEKYLSIITGGKYSEINIDTEEIYGANGSIMKKWNELSRGTKEQLYFALRLGYAANYSKDTLTGSEKLKPALPLIIDDAFVNFDEKRLKNAFKCLDEFSLTNQIFFFTCRESDVNSVCEISGDKVNIIRI